LVQDILPGLLDPDLALPERRSEGALVVSAAFRYTRVLHAMKEGAMLMGAVFNILRDTCASCPKVARKGSIACLLWSQ